MTARVRYFLGSLPDDATEPYIDTAVDSSTVDVAPVDKTAKFIFSLKSPPGNARKQPSLVEFHYKNTGDVYRKVIIWPLNHPQFYQPLIEINCNFFVRYYSGKDIEMDLTIEFNGS